MRNSRCVRLACVSAAALLTGLSAASQANAGSFGIREQSTYFQGAAYAGAAAGGDTSSMFWNSAATASLPGFNAEASSTLIFVSADMTAMNGVFYTGIPDLAPGLSHSANIGADAYVPAIYGTYQMSDRIYAGIAVNSPFALTSKPDHPWAGTPIGITSKIRSFDFNPAIAYKITPELSVGVGAQAEYFRIKLRKGSFNSFDAFPLYGEPVVAGARNYEASDWGAGATAGIMW